MADQGDPGRPHSKAQSLHAPWRLSYMDMLSAQDKAGRDAPGASIAVPTPDAKSTGSCFLREYWLNTQDDEKNHVIVRTGFEAGPPNPGGGGGPAPGAARRGGLIMLNRYPYANGHLLVCLGEGRGRLLEYSDEQRAELWSLTDLAVDLAERTLGPQGLNIGVNQGLTAGAGVPGHVHVHVVPRWGGDVNFMEVCAHVRVIPSALEDMARRYRDVWDLVRAM